ncbi:MAG: hypothetical protein AB7F41_17005 [Methylocystis sp.]|uniref:hypothetical protein n=1 Tax=Methylocystis sp. TaxID=1911079 RepID=UPI003D12A8E9
MDAKIVEVVACHEGRIGRQTAHHNGRKERIVENRAIACHVVRAAKLPSAHIAHGPVLQIENTIETPSDGTTHTSLGAATVLSRCAKYNMQTNTSFAQRKASVSSLYLALLIGCMFVDRFDIVISPMLYDNPRATFRQQAAL